MKDRLLVVDDEEMNRNMLSRRLERAGFRVEVARDGAEALRMMDQQAFDLILLDQMMPERSGSEVLRELRMLHSAAELPVIMVTAVADSGKVAEALDSVANDYVTKPVDFAVALARIRSQLSRKHAETARKHSEERYALAARAAHDGLWDWDLLTDRIEYSERWKNMLDLQGGDIGDSPGEWLSRVHVEDLAGLRQGLAEHLENASEAFECEYRIRAGDNHYRWMEARGMAVCNSDGEPIRMAGSQSDITARKTIDALTGLPNRTLFSERAEAALLRAGEEAPWGFTVFFIDLDRFKLVNDSLGHVAGDQLLVQFSRRLCEAVQDYREPVGAGAAPHVPLVARLGGDEFTILIGGMTDSSAAASVAGRVLNAMRPPFQLERQEFFASASIGIAVSRLDHHTVTDILREADTAMYVAKSRGRACCAVFDEPMRDRAANRLRLESDLRIAIGKGQLVVFYQPRVDLDSERICGFEALLRWKHPARGLIPPSEFIPMAEETGMIREIGLWVLREACAQIKLWRRLWPRAEALDMAVNVSPVQLRDPELLSQVKEVLEEAGLEPSALQIEITESSVFDNIEEARGVLLALKKLGVGLKLDDFATGYSCLGYLGQLPFDSIKIDRSFTVDLGHQDSEKRELVRTIMDMARNLNLGVIAEGIEDKEAAAVLKQMGCRFAQGYYFSRPVEPGAIERLLAKELIPELESK
ncbi:MAG: EAL domain-containing protein [Bryobacteraceae bacterium]|jgi:diguanylate cyclase (GGDEF)-like protein